MYQQVNTLFLDEPTNHLDVMSREWVEDAIDDFSETMLFVSHDRYFINRFATRIWQVEPDGTITDFQGGYADFRAQRLRQEQVEAAKREQEKKAEKEAKAQEKQAAARAKQPGGNSKQLEKRRRELQKEINAAEKKLEQLSEEMAACPGDDYTRLNELYSQQEVLEERLLELYEQQEALEGEGQ
jgi:ATPase subunit of ABC transporter with duplicated ATPase domains